MKKLFLLCLLAVIFSCEEVIDIPLNEAEPRLVIEASINWVKGTDGRDQEIKLSLSTPFFEDGITPAVGATVRIDDSSGNTYDFIEISGTGLYRNNSFAPVLNETYNLTILYEEEVYVAQETMVSVVPIDFVEQEAGGGFGGDEIEVKAYYTDPAGVENYYFFEFLPDFTSIPDLEVYEDRFTDGNQIFGFYSSEDIKAGDELNIRIHGVSNRFYDFMFILLQQGEGDGGPFETQPATVRGNCINQTNPENFPYGYFRLSEVDEVTYIVQ